MAEAESRFDERDIQFARYRLKQGTPEYAEYYGRHPELRALDDRARALPGLLSSESLYYHPLDTAAAVSSFQLIDRLRNSVDGASGEKTGLTHDEILSFLVEWMRQLGADATGTGPISPSAWYSHVGRGTGGYGTKIPVEHSYALVIGCEMKAEPVSRAPRSPEVVEAAARYAQCAFLAVQAAEFLRLMGYSARAHIDGNYRVIAAEAARETGLGSYGWSGLLLTEKYGPRIRFSVVTTDLPMPPPERPVPDFLKFCRLCRKCVANCPSRSISMEMPGKVNGDRCFAYWNTVGTDCGVCMAVCPLGRNPGFLKELALRYRPAARLLLRLDGVSYRNMKAQREGTE